MAGRLKDKVALVFGAGSSGPGWGNGKATAVSFAREGATVMRGRPSMREAAEETRKLIADEGGKRLADVADVTQQRRDQGAWSTTWSRECGRIDILHNNVGITAMGGPIEESEESWHRVIDINLTSVFLTCKHVLPVMLRQGKGAIVNVSSIAAIRYTGYPYSSYYASKAGAEPVHRRRRAAVREARHPRQRDHAGHDGHAADLHADRRPVRAAPTTMIAPRNAACPMGRMGTGWEIANAAVFLASDEAQLHHRRVPAGGRRDQLQVKTSYTSPQRGEGGARCEAAGG